MAKRRLFLCGPSGCGKSALIRELLGPALAGAGGFLTERICAPDGRPLGCELLPSAAAGGVEGFLPARFLDFSTEPPTRDNEVFRIEAVRLLQEAEYYPFVLLDEIGGFEMVIPQFRAALAAFLNSSVPCIGVLMSLPDAAALQRRLGLGDRYPAFVRQLRAALESDGGTLVLDTTGRGDSAAEQAVRSWAEEYVF